MEQFQFFHTHSHPKRSRTKRLGGQRRLTYAFTHAELQVTFIFNLISTTVWSAIHVYNIHTYILVRMCMQAMTESANCIDLSAFHAGSDSLQMKEVSLFLNNETNIP